MVWSNAGETFRSTVMGRRGMVASAHPLASLAGLRTLIAGGNAIDAAVATMAALNVVEPYMSGLGGGGAMLLHLANGDTQMLDYSGRAPRGAELTVLDSASVDIGPRALTTPSALAGWLEALARYGTKSPTEVFAPAIEYAEEGVPLTVKNVDFFRSGDERVRGVGRDIFFANGIPAAGSICRQPELAATYRVLAQKGADELYHGETGKRLVAAVQQAGGFLTEEDLANVTVLGSAFRIDLPRL